MHTSANNALDHSTRRSRSRHLVVAWLAALFLSVGAHSGSAHASPQQAKAAIDLPASVEPLERAQIHTRLAGYVAEVRIELGDVVSAGQVLLRIDRPELNTELAQARAELEERAKLVASARAMLEQARAAQRVAEQQLARWEAEVALQTATLKRHEELHAERAITEQQLDEQRARSSIARADLEVARVRAQASAADTLAANAKVEVAGAQSNVASARAAHVEAQLSLLELRAPFAGVVTERRVSPGDLAQPSAPGGAALLVVQRVDRVRVQVDAPEHLAARVGPGTPVEIRAAGGAPVAAQVTRTAGAIDARSRTLRVEIELDNSAGRWLSGSYVQAAFTVSGEVK